MFGVLRGVARGGDVDRSSFAGVVAYCHPLLVHLGSSVLSDGQATGWELTAVLFLRRRAVPLAERIVGMSWSCRGPQCHSC